MDALFSSRSIRRLLASGRVPVLQSVSLAAIAVATVFAIRELFIAPLIGLQAPLILFLAAVAAASFCGGLLGGVWATAFSALVGAYFLLPPVHSFMVALPVDRLRILIFVCVGLVISTVGETLGSLRRAKRETERKLATLLGNLPGVGYRSAYDRGFRPRFVSEGVLGLAGVPPQSFTSGSVRWVELIHPEDRDSVRGELRRAVVERRRFQLEYRIRDVRGREKWVWEQGLPVFDESSGELAALEGFIIEITDRKVAEQALREAERHKDEFLATLAHEVRNPLSVIVNALEVMRLGPGGDSELRGVMSRQAKHLERLVNDLIDVARIARGEIELQRAEVDLARVAESAIESAKFLTAPLEQELELALEGERGGAASFPVHADFDRLVQVLSNLLHNAAKFTPRGGRISVTIEERGGEAVVRVKDTGMGIPSDRLSSVFEMFHRGPEASPNATGGLGIGLTLARRLVELHGGRIEARSDGPGQGSEFIVRLPLVSSPVPAAR